MTETTKRIIELKEEMGLNDHQLELGVAHNVIKKATKEYHLHELRHTFGTIAICVQKLDPKTVSLYMGHSTIGMTLSTYTHPEQLDKSLFYDGSLSEEEKLSRLKEQYQYILEQISQYLSGFTKDLPKKM